MRQVNIAAMTCLVHFTCSKRWYTVNVCNAPSTMLMSTQNLTACHAGSDCAACCAQLLGRDRAHAHMCSEHVCTLCCFARHHAAVLASVAKTLSAAATHNILSVGSARSRLPPDAALGVHKLPSVDAVLLAVRTCKKTWNSAVSSAGRTISGWCVNGLAGRNQLVPPCRLCLQTALPQVQLCAKCRAQFLTLMQAGVLLFVVSCHFATVTEPAWCTCSAAGHCLQWQSFLFSDP
jgi:hypothetical protein